MRNKQMAIISAFRQKPAIFRIPIDRKLSVLDEVLDVWLTLTERVDRTGRADNAAAVIGTHDVIASRLTSRLKR